MRKVSFGGEAIYQRLFAQTSQWKPNTSVWFTENSSQANIVTKGHQLILVDQTKSFETDENTLNGYLNPTKEVHVM